MFRDGGIFALRIPSWRGEGCRRKAGASPAPLVMNHVSPGGNPRRPRLRKGSPLRGCLSSEDLLGRGFWAKEESFDEWHRYIRN